jgi:hypothetical protein
MKVTHLFAEQSKKEDLMDYAAIDCPPVAEVEEWMNPAKETLDAAAENGNDPTRIALEMVVLRFAYLSTTIKSFKAVGLELNLSGMRTKQVLFNHIRDSGHVDLEILGDNKFAQCRVVDPAGSKIEAWVILTPEVLLSVPGVNIWSGAQDGFYGPTNKGNAVGGTRSNFLNKDKIARPPFVKKGQ